MCVMLCLCKLHTSFLDAHVQSFWSDSQGLVDYSQMLVPVPHRPSPGLGGHSGPLGRLVLCLRLNAWAESSLLSFMHTRYLMRQLLGSQLRAQAPSALWLRPSWGAGGLCTQHPASKESKAGPHVFLCQWVPHIPYCPPSPTLPLTCPVGLETQVQAGQLAPPATALTGQELIDSELPGQPTAGGRNAARAPGKGPWFHTVPRSGGFVITLGVNSDLLTERMEERRMSEQSHQTLSSPGTMSRRFWLRGKHSQNSPPVEKGRRVGWTRMPFFSETVEGSVWILVQDVRSRADGCLAPARLLPRGCVFTRKGSVPAAGQVFRAPPTGCAWRPSSLALARLPGN